MYFWVFNTAVYILCFLDPKSALQLIKDGDLYTCMTPGPTALVAAPGQCSEPMPSIPANLFELLKEGVPEHR
jgi:hypothetical protein